jgi:hypothetical protein
MKPYITIILFLLSITGYAQSMKLALTGEEWKDVSEYAVKGRQGILINQKLSFGEYKTLLVDRSWTKGSTVFSGFSYGIPTDAQFQKIIGSNRVKKNQTLYFSLQDSSGLQGRAYCVSKINSRDFIIGDNPNSPLNISSSWLEIGDKNSNTFYALIYDAEASTRWELLLDNVAVQEKPKSYAGYLIKSADEYYQIKPAQKVVTKKGKVNTIPFGSIGFEIFTKEGEPVAAVSMIDSGVVFLKPLTPEQRILLATTCAALLLQEQI